ncbi:hypothetical protein Pst134EA_031219 [Puccinia striiformis f. sp. tritici]|uniref:uncharacterized protein n=1 Tax=Puccinia striiformis f. sp. tritici TaxID=168172 RepID=UPI0020076125|nr:uncharacterized protein Pst134EA_031219 [Puccinia striiformis f. sp. tritici]KAH9445385.1 hypothetical protein Pst134EA_031219 [Puccinia striiformis f. sp. tritici]
MLPEFATGFQTIYFNSANTTVEGSQHPRVAHADVPNDSRQIPLPSDPSISKWFFISGHSV